MAKTIIDELVTVLGIELQAGMVQKIEALNKSLHAIGDYAKIAGAAIVTSASGIALFVESATHSAAQLQKFTDLTGMSSEAVQRWGYAVEQAGGHADDVKGDIAELVRAFNAVLPEQMNQGLLAMGMYETKFTNMSDKLIEMSRKFKNMTPGQQMNWAQMAGISQSLLMLMKLPEEKIVGLLGKATVIPEENIRKSRQFERNLDDLKNQYKVLASTIGSAFAPELIKITEKFQEWVSANKEWIDLNISAFISGVGKGISEFYDDLKNGLEIFGFFTKGLLDIEKTATATKVALDALALVIAVKYRWLILIATSLEAIREFANAQSSDVDPLTLSKEERLEKYPLLQSIRDKWTSILPESFQEYFNPTNGNNQYPNLTSATLAYMDKDRQVNQKNSNVTNNVTINVNESVSARATADAVKNKFDFTVMGLAPAYQ